MEVASVPPTVFTAGCGAMPLKPDPSYATTSRTRTSGPEGPLVSLSPVSKSVNLDQFDPGHGCVVAVAGAELEDAGVAAVAVGVARGHVVEQLVSHVLVADEGDDLAVVVHAALLGLGDDLLDDRADGLGLGLGGDQALGGD